MLLWKGRGQRRSMRTRRPSSAFYPKTVTRSQALHPLGLSFLHCRNRNGGRKSLCREYSKDSMS